MNNYALTFVSKDRPGIVAEATKVLFEKGFNIADSSSTLLQGVFSMILLVQHKETFTADEIKSFFVASNLKPAVHNITANGEHKPVPTDDYIISVYGADKPGIVHKITAKLYEQNVNIVDLQTQAVDNNGSEVYIMILEVLVPISLQDTWQEPLKKVAKELGTDITIRQMETYEL